MKPRNFVCLFLLAFTVGALSVGTGSSQRCCKWVKDVGCECWSDDEGNCYRCLPITF